MSSLEPDDQSSISTITIKLSKEDMTHKLKFSCRLCLNEKRSQVSLFERTSRRTNLTNADIVQLFTDIAVDASDGLPGMICTKCENMLHLILDFKIECQDSNETLLAFYEMLNSKEEVKDVESPFEMLEEGEVEEQEQEMFEANMSVEALELEDHEEDEEMKTDICKTEIEIEELEMVENEMEELKQTNANEEFVFETDEKEDIILISVVDDESPNILVETEISYKKTFRNKNSKCPECGKRVEGPAKLKRHMRVHEREKKKALSPLKQPKQDPTPPITIFSCDICQKEFTLPSRLKKHLETHLPMAMRKKPYICHCGKEYLDSGALRTHQLIAHSDNIPTYACEVCYKEFTRKNYRDYHQRLHSSDKPHTCDLCDFRSAKKHNLVRHLLVHTNEFNFECDTCGRKFKRKTGLDSHLKTHGCKCKITKKKTYF